jgi:DNA modification methylase
VLRGSCLDILPTLKAKSFDGLITSPPYCNRYDYTRTYALELAMLKVGEDGIRDLRQTMLTCTVENKEKLDLEKKFGKKVFNAAKEAFESQEMLTLVLSYLEQCKKDETINNPSIVRMVKNYFFELALLIFASAKVLKPNAPFVMVNDNVRYEGAHLPVDLILSDFAEQAGFDVERIWVLPRGKGNSSQQMGIHGRQEIRKCVYIWRVRG